MQRIYASLIDVFDQLAMLPVKKQNIFLILSSGILFLLLWFLMLHSSWQTLCFYQKQHQLLLKQTPIKKAVAQVGIIEKKIGAPLFCEQEINTKQKIGTIKIDEKIINYYETGKSCLVKEEQNQGK